jgi:hypothetical protein
MFYSKRHILKKILILLVFLLSAIFSNGQDLIGKDLKGIKSIIQFKDTIPNTIKHVDSNGNITFDKYFGETYSNFTTSRIYCYFYNNLNRVTKTIYIQDDSFGVFTFEYDSLNKKRMYAYKCSPEKESLYHYYIFCNISKFKNANDIAKDTMVLSILNTGKQYLYAEFLLDKNGKVMQSISFNENGDTISIVTNKYDSFEKLIHINEVGIYSTSIYYTDAGKFDNNYYFFYDKKGNCISNSCINHKGDTTACNQYKYNKKNQQIEHSSFTNGELVNTQMIYYAKGKVIRAEYYEPMGTLYMEFFYKYNKKGDMIEEKFNNIERNELHTTSWKYEYY